MPAFNVGVNSTFEQQRQIINSIAVDTFALSTTLSGITSAGLVVTYSESAGIASYAPVSGVATVANYAISSGIASYASIAGVSTYAIVAGISTYSPIAGVATYALVAGVSTYASVAGLATNAAYATQSGETAFAPYAGISTYADTAGIATNAQGLTGSPNVIVGVITGGLFVGNGSELTGINVGVSTYADVAGVATAAGNASTADYASIAGLATAAAGLTGTPNLNVGILTATKFAANDAEFTGILTAQSLKAISGYVLSPDSQQSIQILSGSGSVNLPLGVGTDLNVAGIVTALNFVGDGSQLTGINTIGVTTITAGDNILVTQTGQVAIITATFSGGATGFFEGTNGVGIGTTSKVGIGTTIPTQMLTVKGNIDLDGNIVLNGEISAPTRIKFGTGGENIKIGDITGGSGAANVAIGDQALSLNSSGAGHNIAIGQLAQYGVNSGQYNLTIGDRAGQNLTSGSYNVLLGAYSGNQNGLDLRTSSNNVVLSDGEGNVRQFINSSGDVGIKTTIITEALTVAGIVSATSFYGTLPASQLTGALPSLDGSALTGVTAIGSGVEIRDSDSPVGAAATINFGNNLSVVLSAGIATITGSNTASFATNAGGLTGNPSINVSDITSDGQYTGFTSMTGDGNHFFTMRTNGNTGAVVGINTIPQNDLEGFGTLILDGTYYVGSDLKGGGNIEMRNMGKPYFSTACYDSVGLTSFIGYSQATQTYLHKPYLYRAAGSGQALIGITTIGNIGIATLTPTTTLDVFGDAKVSGALTATSLSGSLAASNLTGALPAIDGSNLLNVTAAGTGVNIQDDGVGVGAAATVINFASGLNVVASAGIATVTGSGGGAQSRNIVSGVTTSIPNLGIGNTDIIGQKSYALMKVGLSTTGWIRLYTDSTSRSNDVSRSVGEDPAPGSGVIAEVVTTGISTQQMITPFAMGGNMDEPVTNKIYVAIQNLSGSTQTITANLTILQLEA
jgi:hypothetical protein